MSGASAPLVERVILSVTKEGRLHRAVFDNIANADARLGQMFDTPPAPVAEPLGWAGAVVYWSDGYELQARFYVTREHMVSASADGGLLRHALLRDARLEAAPSSHRGQSRAIVARRTALGREMLARIEADAAAHRNAGASPRVARVHITEADSPAVRRGAYLSIAHADAMLDRAYATVPAPDSRPFHLLEAVVVWTDGYELRPRAFINGQFVRDAQADGGILRHALLRAARLRASPDAYEGARPDVIAQHTAAGRAVLARIEADAREDDERRNAAPSGWKPPTLLPDPADAIRRLGERFAGRREIVRAIGEWDGDERAAYPATNQADVRYVVNYVSFALRNDVATLNPTAGAVIWNHWTSVRDTIETLLRGGDDSDRYEDNEGLWVRQLPALVHLLNDAREEGSPLRNGRPVGGRDDTREEGSPLRNGRLAFRPVGGRGDAYPPWVADLRGRSGVYVIRAPGESGDLEVVYVGSSSADRLHETLTRHFQAWRRWKGFWRGQYGEGHDPGLTYDRDTAEAAVIITPPQHAYELEMRLIRRLRPRDNLVGQAVEEEVPF